MLPHEKDIAAGNRTEYAVARDFCRIFAENMDGVYTLALLLTGDQAAAERCFGSALEDCLGATRVFKEWSTSWARRAVIRNSVRMVKPAPESTLVPAFAQENSKSLSDSQLPLKAIFQLKTFERFVFVMSVLEHCSDHDGTVLLDCSRSDYVRARSRAMARVASFVEKESAPASAGAAALPPFRLAARVA